MIEEKKKKVEAVKREEEKRRKKLELWRKSRRERNKSEYIDRVKIKKIQISDEQSSVFHLENIRISASKVNNPVLRTWNHR